MRPFKPIEDQINILKNMDKKLKPTFTNNIM